MSLMELCRTLESTLAQLEAARRGALDGEAIDERTRQWTMTSDDLRSARQRAEWLQIDLMHLAFYPDQLAYTRDLAQQAAQRLEQRQSVEVLTEEDLWVRLLQTTQKTAALARDQVKLGWRLRLEEYQQLSPTQQLRATASPVPQNAMLLEEYDAQYRNASRLAALEAPKSASDPGNLFETIKTCRTLAAQLEFNAPKEVEDFFRAINAGSASLALVTPTVLVWLADNDQLDRFAVRSSGR